MQHDPRKHQPQAEAAPAERRSGAGEASAQMMLSTIEQQMGDKQQMIDLTSSFEWDMMIDLCERDWPFLEGCSEEELDTLAELVDVAEDLLDLPAQMPPTKMPSDVYWEVINVVDSYHKNRRRNGDVI